MTVIESITLDVPDSALARAFYTDAFGLDGQVALRTTDGATTGFRGFTLSLKVAQPATVQALTDAAVDAGATPLKPPKKSLWGFGGVVQAPDGTIWQVVSSAKQDTGPTTREIDDVVLLVGAADVGASKRFYVERGLTVAKSFGRKYVEFDTAASPIKLALYGRRALAKLAGVPADGTGSPGIAITSDLGPFTDPDGFSWQPARVSGRPRGAMIARPRTTR